MAIVSSGMKALPMPRPIAKQAKKIVGKKAVSGPTVANRSSPATALAMPAVSTRNRPEAPDQPRGDALREDGDGQRPGQERRAGLQGAVVADVLEVERAEEEGRVHPGDEEAADEARVDQPAQAQDAQRHDRVLDPALERRGTPPSARPRARPMPSTWDDVQPWLVASTIA